MMKMRSFQLVVMLVLAVVGRIQAQPIIQQQPSSQVNLPVGTNVQLCVAAFSTNSLQYQWLRNGVIEPFATNSCLDIDDLQATNCGAFSVLVGDGVGVVVSQPADVTVQINALAGEDIVAQALSLSTVTSPVRSDNINAVKEPGTPYIIPNDPGGSEIWFRWSAPPGAAGGVVVFSTLGSDFDTTLGAYFGASPGNLAPVPTAINDDDTAGYLNSQILFYAEPGATYSIAVDGFYGAQGHVVLSWTFSPGSALFPPSVPTPLAIAVSNGASLILNVPWSQDATCDWFQNGQIVPSPGGGVLVLTNVGDATVGSYVAGLLNPNNPNGVSDVSEPTLVQINTLQDGSTDTNSIAWVKFRDSANNAFLQPNARSHRIKLGGGDTAGFSCSQVFSTVGNPDEPGEPVIANQIGGHPSWYSYVTPASGPLLVSTAGSDFNTLFGVFIGPGDSFSTLTNIGSGYTTNYSLNGQPSVYIPNVPGGQTNYILVEGENAASGVVHLNIYLGTLWLNIAPTNGGTVISWPAAGGTNLQVSTQLAQGWQPANTPFMESHELIA
jgi:hypothetical protein